jgi:hypothetical protein
MEKWKRFERLAAALHAVQMKGATVKWDDHINGYQVDVSIRFSVGPYHYLHIMECRDHRRAVERDDVAAFVIKVEQTRADRGTFVSASGFQSGARELAALKDIDLFVQSEIPADWPETVLRTIPTPFIGVRQIRIRPRGQKEWQEVAESHAARFMTHARFHGRNNRALTVENRTSI